MDDQEIIERQLLWHREASQGCHFAAILATEAKAESAGINRIVFSEALTENLIKKLVKHVSEQVANPEISLVTAVIPDIDSKEKLLQFINLIKDKNFSNWTVDDTEIYQESKLVKIRIPLEENDENGEPILAWALIFGALPFFPKTRQSPFFEFAVSVKTRYFLKDKYNRISLTQQSPETENRGGSSTDAHLADVFIEGVTNHGIRDKRVWKNTRNRKKEILTQKGTIPFDDTNAKAKITCSYPI